MKIRLFALLLVTFLTFPFASQAATNEAESVVEVVSTFYRNYISALEAYDSTYKWSEQPEVDPDLIKKIAALFDEVEEDEDGERILGYAPILMAQDWPATMEYATPIINGDVAEIIAYTVWGDNKVPLCVTVANREDVWRITDIIDMRHFDGETPFKCGGMKL